MNIKIKEGRNEGRKETKGRKGKGRKGKERKGTISENSENTQT